MDRLAFLSPTEVAALSRHEREERVRLLVQQSHNILTRAIERHANADGRTLVGTVVLFSGGNDSTVLAHLNTRQICLSVNFMFQLDAWLMSTEKRGLNQSENLLHTGLFEKK